MVTKTTAHTGYTQQFTEAV